MIDGLIQITPYLNLQGRNLMTTLWIVGKNLNLEDNFKSNWEFIGVFNCKDKAIRACIKNEYFIGPAILNKALPDTTVEWKGAYYPRLQN